MMLRKNTLLLLSVLFISQISFAQEVNIVSYLKQIEAGEKDKVAEKLSDLKDGHPNDPSVMFLEGILTENGQEAISIYQKILDKYPQSRYADAALYRIYSYYYALGLYQTSKTYIERLKKDYSKSPYIKIAENKFPSRDETAPEVKPEPEKPAPEKETKNLEYKFTIQAGAFSNNTNAKALKKRFEDAGFYSEIKEKIVGGSSFHVVFVGKFLNTDEAGNFLDIINLRFSLDGRIVPID